MRILLVLKVLIFVKAHKYFHPARRIARPAESFSPRIKGFSAMRLRAVPSLCGIIGTVGPRAAWKRRGGIGGKRPARETPGSLHSRVKGKSEPRQGSAPAKTAAPDVAADAGQGGRSVPPPGGPRQSA